VTPSTWRCWTRGSTSGDLSGRYLIVDQDSDPGIERWEFEPGTVVTCRKQRRDGRQILIATEAARRTVAG
jgi:hypothetical protein